MCGSFFSGLSFGLESRDAMVENTERDLMPSAVIGVTDRNVAEGLGGMGEDLVEDVLQGASRVVLG